MCRSRASAPGSPPGSGSATGRRRSRARGDRVEQRGGRGGGGQLLAVGAVVGEAVAAFGRAHDRAALAHDLRGGRHALDRLVEVLVEREARVRREHDVEAAAARRASRSAGRPRRRPRASRTARRRTPARSASRRRARRRARSAVPVAAAIARTSSCTGLPCVTPQRASGWPMRAASCRVSVVSRPARPGATSFGPPEKPGEEVRLDEPGRDADVGLDPLAVQPDRDVRRRSGPSRSATRRRARRG